jgi:lambda family phage portal protein
MNHEELKEAIGGIGGGKIERAIGKISPAWGRRRMENRVKQIQYRYEAARFDRFRESHKSPEPHPESSTASSDRIKVAREAQNLAQNWSVAAGILRLYAVHVAGQLRYQADTGDEATNKAVDDYVANWSTRCDITGRHDLRTFSQLAVQAEKRDGDIGFADIITGDGQYKLRAIEYDRIGDPNSASVKDDYVSGIHIDPITGAPTGYDIFKRSKQSGQYSFDTTVPAAHFHHYFSPFRTDEYRGVSAFAPVVNTAKDIKEIMEAARVRIKYSASVAGLITKADGVADAMDHFTGAANSGSKPEESTSFGILKYLSPGEDVKEMEAKFPETVIVSYLEMLIREIAVCLKLPYGFVWDLSALKGPGARFEAAMAQRTFEQEQMNLSTRFLNPVKNRALLHGALTGSVDIEPFNQAVFRGKWVFSPELTIDFGRDMRADIEAYRAGLLSEKDFYGQDAKDWRQERRQMFIEKAEDKRLAKEFDVRYIDQRNITPSGQIPTEQKQPSAITEPE